MNEKKIFAIGFPKTGTTSLNSALTTFGYKVKSHFGLDDPDISRNVYEMAFRFVEQYDAFEDAPWCFIYKELDKKYPGSKFILTLRPTEKWIKSQVDHFTQTRPMREWIYGAGCPKGNEDIYIARYERHNKEVLEYFKDRPDDLLVLRLTEGEGWEKLCQFLHKDVPDIEFPHENKGVERARKRKRKKIRRVIKRSFIVLAGLLLLGIVLYWMRFSFIKKDVWSISIYTGSDPFSLSPHPRAQNPVVKASDVAYVPAFFVADPFMVKDNNTWFMFFEVLNKSSQQGDIGLAMSDDGIVWRYARIVLDEPFHLSYPYVFKWKDSFYMVPESVGAHGVRLYKATEFPYHWTFVIELITGDFVDPSLIFKDGKWWLFVLKPGDKLALYYADDLRGPWTEHPASPLITGDKTISRPGGRLIMFGEKIIRYTQMDSPSYGSALRAFQIDELTAKTYREHELPQSPILSASGKGWNETGMHHIDPHQIKGNEWIACVDGKTQIKVFDGKTGVDRMLRKLKKLIK
jgi:hypothetical protein